jgi:hypothetical protein
MARRLLGSSLRELDVAGYTGVAARFEKNVLQPVTKCNVLS